MIKKNQKFTETVSTKEIFPVKTLSSNPPL